MQRFRKAIKRMAAIGAGVAMLGATMAGAVAQDLSSYPQPFISKEGVFNDATTIVVGANAAASDTLGAVNIATKLQFEAKTPVTSGGGKLQVSGGLTADIPLGRAIANNTAIGFDWGIDHTQLDSFQSTKVSFQGKNYDVHDQLVLSKTSPSVETSLTSTDDNYETNVFLEAVAKNIKYYYVFDDKINVSKATQTDPLEIKFLGKTLKITSVGTSTQNVGNRFTAYVGGEYFMNAGDTVTVEGKKITLKNVGEGGSILVDVDGTVDTISARATKTINGIEISNDETFYTNEVSERSASLIIGKESQATYTDTDAFIGEDANDPNWEWNIANLQQEASTIINSTVAEFPSLTPTAGPILGVQNSFTKTDDTTNPPGIGECYNLPNDYVSVCLDSLTVPNDDYLEVKMKYFNSFDTSRSGAPGSATNANVVEISAPGTDRFVIKTTDFASVNTSNNPTDQKTSQIFLQALNGAPQQFLVFYRDPNRNPTLVYAGNLSLTGDGTGGVAINKSFKTLAQINYKDTKQGNAVLQVGNYSGVTKPQIILNMTGDSTAELDNSEDLIITNWTLSSGVFNSLGATQGTEEAGEIVWTTVNTAGANTNLNIGAKSVDERSKYGIIIKDPKSNGASDQVVLLIPSNQVKANVVVKGPSTKVSGGAVSYIPADISINTRLDTEIAGSEANYDLILVGGPCANKAVEAVGLLTCDKARSQLAPGEAIIQMAKNGQHVALLVAGYEATETRMAAKVLANYENYAGKLTGSQVKVTGTINQPVVTAAATTA